MAVASAKLRFYRQSPKKVRQVVDILRGLNVPAAEAQLEVLPKRAARALQKLLNSAIANAQNLETGKEKDKLPKDRLYISEIRVDQGPTYKRFRARAHGRAGAIRKRSSHISLILDERIKTEAETKPAKSAKPAANKKDKKEDKQEKKVVKSAAKPKVKKKI
jgi:large subunit ribosomal protein L22